MISLSERQTATSRQDGGRQQCCWRTIRRTTCGAKSRQRTDGLSFDVLPVVDRQFSRRQTGTARHHSTR